MKETTDVGVTGSSHAQDLDFRHWVGIANTLLRHRRLIVAVALVTGFVVAVVVFFRPRMYESTSSFIPVDQSQNSLSQLAAAVGLGSGGQQSSESPEFYVQLLKSREILAGAVETPYQMQDGGRIESRTLEQMISPDGNRDRLREAASLSLRASMEITEDPRTGIVKLGVKNRDPQLAQQINRRLLELIGRFNQDTRQSQAAAERKFAESRMVEIRSKLDAAEERLADFLTRNRQYRESPELAFQYDRMQRDVTLQQGLYTTVSQAYEQAKLQEVRNTPVLTIIEQPDKPISPTRRKLIFRTLIGLLAGAAVGMFLGFVKDLKGTANEAPEIEEFDRLRQETLADLRHPVRTLRTIKVFASTSPHSK